MTSEITKRDEASLSGAIMQEVMGGNLERLTPAQRVELHNAVCHSVGLNPLTHPFDFISFPARGNEPAKTILYPNATAFSQLTSMHKLSIDYSDIHEDQERGLIIQWCTVTDGQRTGKDMGVLSTTGRRKDGSEYQLTGQAYADAMMKVMTKARRRAISAFSGMPLNGFGGDGETERDPLDGARIVDVSTGEILERPAPASLPEREPAYAVERAPEPVPFDPQTVPQGGLAKLQAAVAGEGLEWGSFLAILGVTDWAEYCKDGATPGDAWKAYHSYKLEKELREEREAKDAAEVMQDLPPEPPAVELPQDPKEALKAYAAYMASRAAAEEAAKRQQSRAVGDQVLDEEVGPSAAEGSRETLLDIHEEH